MITWRSRSESAASACASASLRSESSTVSSGSGSSLATKSPKTASSCSPTGWSTLVAAPVELLDRADQAEGAFLDQVEERKPLVAVVLRDRDDEAQVRLDHRLLRVHVAALDALGELDLLRGVQQRMASSLAQEELQRVGRRLLRDGRRRRGWRGRCLFRLVDHLDPALVELAVDRIGLEPS